MRSYASSQKQNCCQTLPFINETNHSKISVFREHIMLASVFYLFFISFCIVWFQNTHHMAPITNEILEIFLKYCTQWVEFLILLAYRDVFYSLFSMLTVHMSSIWSLFESHGCVNTCGWAGVQFHTGQKKKHETRQTEIAGIRQFLTIKIWTILEEGIKNTN